MFVCLSAKTLAISGEWLLMGLSFLVTRPFFWNLYFLPNDFDLGV
jgi:hypothetical protein